MRIFAWVLFALALVASVALGVNWRWAAKAAAGASLDRDHFAANAKDYQAAGLMRKRQVAAEIEDDQLALHNHLLRVTIALLKGQSAALASELVNTDHALLLKDEQVQRLQDVDTKGPDPDVTMSLKRRDAAEASHQVYLSNVVRDRKLAFAAIVPLWIAFGLAFALSLPRPT